MREQVTTLVRTLEDGSQVHVSAPATAVCEVNAEVLDATGTAGEQYRQGLEPDFTGGIGLWLDTPNDLINLPPPQSHEQRILFPLFRAFGKQLYRQRLKILGSAQPVFFRVLGFGPQAGNYDWHCDGVNVSFGRGRIGNITPKGCGRLVVSIDSQLRDETDVNLQFVDGEFQVRTPVPEIPEPTPALLHTRGYPARATIVSRDTGSILRVLDPEFTTPDGTITSLGNYMIGNQTCLTLHRAVPLDDTLRVSYQCLYEGA